MTLGTGTPHGIPARKLPVSAGADPDDLRLDAYENAAPPLESAPSSDRCLPADVHPAARAAPAAFVGGNPAPWTAPGR
ncbi:hypothetical protein [Streptomyces wuyuanensis]|uniref:hypothetical protein n=1 Tax=Streptomyces wuyuanensis TaxID=1196353 RepID=UPI0037A8E44C